MQRAAGFSLLELMITVAIVSIIAAIGYPSYQQYVRRSIRAEGEQFLMDIAQRQEQYFLDQRAYGTALGSAAGELNMSMTGDLAAQYDAPSFTVDNTATPPTFQIKLSPKANMQSDGALLIDNLQQRWRETDGNNTYGNNDCRWEDTRCTPS